MSYKNYSVTKIRLKNKKNFENLTTFRNSSFSIHFKYVYKIDLLILDWIFVQINSNSVRITRLKTGL